MHFLNICLPFWGDPYRESGSKTIERFFYQRSIFVPNFKWVSQSVHELNFNNFCNISFIIEIGGWNFYRLYNLVLSNFTQNFIKIRLESYDFFNVCHSFWGVPMRWSSSKTIRLLSPMRLIARSNLKSITQTVLELSMEK